MRCNKDNLTDQSDVAIGKTPNLDLLVTVRYDGHVRSMVGVHLRRVTKATIPTNQISRLEKHVISTLQ